MKEFNAEGTMGDAYMLLCKLYPLAEKEKVRVYHRTRHRYWYGAIERIYHLHPNVGVRFVNKHARHPDAIELPMYCYPKFRFTQTLDRFDLPEVYAAVNIKSGRHSQKTRAIRPRAYNKIFDDNEHVVVIGDEYSPPIRGHKGNNVINLCNRTHLWEAMRIVKEARVFYGFQGLMCYVALSQKVPSYIYGRSPDDHRAIRENILAHDWKDHCIQVLEG